ncbi:hypothetical protein MaudCBS49596_007252 [Microsporum audouinii]
MARPASPNANYPEVNEYFPNFDFSLLTIPPPDWELYDIPDKTHLRNRAFDLKTFKRLVKHHSWGFDVVIKERKTKEILLQVLKRIIYNHETKHRPSWHQFVSRDCDSGPRLLRQSYNPPQFSRRIPRGVPEWKYSLPEEITPATAMAQSDANAREERSLPDDASVTTQACEPLRPAPPRDTIIPLKYRPTASFPSHQNPIINQDSTNPGSSQRRGTASRFFPPTRTGIQGHATYSPEYQALKNIRTATKVTPNQSQLDYLLRRFISRRAYGLLDSPLHNEIPSAQIRFIRDSVTGPIIGATTFSHLRLSVSEDRTHIFFDDQGALYPFRCRGPLSRNGISDVVDCIIVAGLLTHAGSTIIDKTARLNRAKIFSPPENAFIHALRDCSNDILSDDSVSTVKERLWDAYNQHYQPDLPFAERPVMDPARIWAAFTGPFAQFQFSYTDNYVSCSHSGGTTESVTCRRTVASVGYQDNDNKGVEISALLQRFFRNNTAFKCPNGVNSCSRKRERLFESTPLRLVIQPHRQSRILNTCASSIKVRFANTDGEMIEEEYIFIGGIYRDEKNGMAHHRLCWNDKDNESDGGRFLQIYDASQISGMVPGGIRPRNPYEIAPSTWWVNGYPALLFFEKIIRPPEGLSINEPGHSSNRTPTPIRPAKKDNHSHNYMVPLSKTRQPATPSHTTPQLTKIRTLTGSIRRNPESTSPSGRRYMNEVQSNAHYNPTESSRQVNNTNHDNASRMAQGPYTAPRFDTTINSRSHANGRSQTVLTGGQPYQTTNHSPSMPMSGTPTDAHNHMDNDDRPSLVPARGHQDNNHQRYYSPAISELNTPIDRHVPRGYVLSPEFSAHHQTDAYEEALTTLDTPTSAHHQIYHRPGSASANQEKQRPPSIEVLSSPLSPTGGRAEPAVVINPQAVNIYDAPRYPPPIHSPDMLPGPSWAANINGEIDPQPPILTDTQTTGAANTDAISSSAVGINLEDLEACNWAFDEFLHNDTLLYHIEDPIDANSAIAIPQPPDDLFSPEGQVENTDTTSFTTDEAWLSQWDVNGVASNAGATPLVEDTLLGAPMAGDATSGNSLKRKSSIGDGEWPPFTGEYGDQLKRRG